jgi:mycothiol synthase
VPTAFFIAANVVPGNIPKLSLAVSTPLTAFFVALEEKNEMSTQTFSPTLPTPPARPGYTWRPLQYADLPALRRMLSSAARVDGRTPPDPLEDMQRQFRDPWSAPETNARLAVTHAGEIAVVMRSFVNPQPEAESRAYLWGEIHPAHRGQGLEALVLDWLEARGRQRLHTLPSHLPRELRFSVLDTQQDWITPVEQHGFKPVRYTYRMRRDLAQPIPDRPWPEGLTLTSYRPELDEPMRQAFNDTFRDHWSFEPITPEDWRMFLTGHSAFRPELTFLALAGAEVAGFCLNLVNHEGNQIQGFDEGWIAEVGVRRAWRKHGAASALLCQAMRAFREAGLDYAGLTVDTENPTGALRVYETQGFVIYKRFVIFAKSLA